MSAIPIKVIDEFYGDGTVSTVAKHGKYEVIEDHCK